MKGLLLLCFKKLAINKAFDLMAGDWRFLPPLFIGKIICWKPTRSGWPLQTNMPTTLVILAVIWLFAGNIADMNHSLLNTKVLHKVFWMMFNDLLMCILLEDEVEVEIMWIPSHVGLEGNEIVDKRAWHVALNGAVFDRPLPSVDFQGLARSVLLREWQGKWDAAETGRFTHSILPKVSLRPWFEGQREDRKFVSTVSRIMSIDILNKNTENINFSSTTLNHIFHLPISIIFLVENEKFHILSHTEKKYLKKFFF
jgi:hypothetical protein